MNEIERGKSIARALTGTWRSVPTAILSIPQLRDLSLFLTQTGGGGLLWALARSNGARALAPQLEQFEPLSSSVREQSPDEWRQAYRLHTLQAGIHERNVQELVSHLQGAGIQVLLTKGWSIARLYPEAGLRPYGDIDVAVAPAEFFAAQRVLVGENGRFGAVDLHQSVPELADRSWAQLWRRRQEVELGRVRVSLLSREDQLRHQCLHLLRHGAWRPLWLCDIAVLLESLPDNFDWNYCLSGESCLTEWLLAALGLVERLFGTCVADSHVRDAGIKLSGWLEPVVLRQWGRGIIGDSHNRDHRPISSYLRRPRGIAGALTSRFPNPIEAAFKMGARPASRLPKSVFQLLMLLHRGGKLTIRMMTSSGKRDERQPTWLSISSLPAA